MTEPLIHLVRHGEVANPTGVLYGRLPGFHLSERGSQMAELAAQALEHQERPIQRIISSPLERAVESATPVAERFELDIELDERLLEATSRLEGGQYRMDLSILTKPRAWPYLINPFQPSWGEPFTQVSARVESLLREVSDGAEGDIVLVSHQLPIWLAHRRAAGKSLAHDPRKRRCALSSITTLQRSGDRFVEVGYESPAARLTGQAVDTGAV
ncbi:histidine phosphatase family protein [Diaminobutyricimonas sp. TR449]|uniref:histidine phosphatase family protein n=1 Tax=Diaminobutyricimonas sp. TR449 TaxID=2708076 RepID=UPI00141F0C4C|nr:histidine phosphatase family protein [Diaminobutyricimonas sp. TR449]